MTIYPRVGPTGPPTSKIAIVGEAPGEQETRVGKPFVGPAGRLLDDLLHQAGIGRGECYLTNVVKERPPDNKIEKFITVKGTKVITTPEYDRYEGELFKELRGIEANVVVATGNIPLWALTRQLQITKRRGSIYWSEIIGKKVIPIIHPAACLHGGGKREGGMFLYRYPIILDLKKAKRESLSPCFSPPRRALLTEPTHLEAISWLTRCRYMSQVAFDIETTKKGGEITCVSFAVSPTEAMCIPFSYQGNREYFSLEREKDIWLRITSILEDRRVRKVGQNLAFDMTYLYRRFGIVTRSIDDTMVAMGIAYPDLPKGLDFLVSVYTDEPYYKDEGKARMLSDRTPDQSFWQYNAKDSAVCLEILPKLLEELEEQGNMEAYNRQIALIPSLIYMGERGIRVDREGMKRESLRCGEEILSLTGRLREVVGYDINPNSPSQVSKHFYGIVGERPYKNRKTGNPTVDEDALKRLVRKGYEEADLILEIRERQKIKSTYYDIKLEEDGRMRCSYNPVGAETGRLSSSGTIFGTGGNSQNRPPELKKLLLADEGYVLYEADLAQAENRIVAYVAGEVNMMSAFEEGKDIHRRTAALILDKREEDISDEPGSCPFGKGRQSERFWGKKSNHSLNYGLGYKSFSLACEISEAEGKFIVERYHQAYPGVRGKYHRMVKDSLARDRSLIDPFGKKRVFLGEWGEKLFMEAYAHIPQSTVGHIINQYGINFLYGSEYYLLHPVDPLAQIHDSIAFQYPMNEGWDGHALLLKLLRNRLEQEIKWEGRRWTIPVEIKMGRNMGEMRKVKVNDSLTGEDLRRIWEGRREEDKSGEDPS